MIEFSDSDARPCIGEEQCTRLQMDPAACDGCPSLPPLIGPWAAHVFRLDAMVQAGCRFALDDLDVHEWRGLEILVEERARYHNAKMSDLKNRR